MLSKHELLDRLELVEILDLTGNVRRITSYSAAVRATTSAPPTDESGSQFTAWLLRLSGPAANGGSNGR